MRVPKRRSENSHRLHFDPHLTQAAYDKLKAKLEHLKKVTRLRWMQEVATLAEGGDFSENAGYQIAKGRLRGINQAILDLEQQLKQAIIIPDTTSSEIVQVGCTVTLEIDGERKVYTLLGSAETDPIQNIISIDSPLGSALLGKRVGEKIILCTAQKKAITILEIT